MTQNRQQQQNPDQAPTKRQPKTWFITGSSRGFGRIWAQAALERGDKVAATARNIQALADLKEKYGQQVLTLTLDVTQPDQIKASIKAAFDYFGQVDIIINNAGYGLVGTVEESDPEDIRRLYETNIMGPVQVIQEVMPYLRKQGSGHILGVSSGLGHLAYPLIGYYCSSKWAFEAIHESLAKEIKPFGIKVTIIEPGAYQTEFGSPSSIQQTTFMDIYSPLRQQVVTQLSTMEQGNPHVTPAAVFAVVDSPLPPLRINLGSGNLPEVKAAYKERIDLWEDWATISDSVQS